MWENNLFSIKEKKESKYKISKVFQVSMSFWITVLSKNKEKVLKNKNAQCSFYYILLTLCLHALAY